MDNITLGIPKRLGHIWIGTAMPPLQWMNTWKEKHPDYEYTLYDNDFFNSFNFKTKKLINEYLRLKQYAGVADLMRYEILYEYGGFIAPADSICYHNISELLTKKCAYTVYENELVRGKLVSPILACEPQNAFVGLLIDELSMLDIKDLDEPWRITGNLFLAKMIEKHKPDIHIFPSHYFIPVHFEGIAYEGNAKIYAKQLFGSTRGVYGPRIEDENEKQIAEENRKIFDYFRAKRLSLFDIDYSDI